MTLISQLSWKFYRKQCSQSFIQTEVKKEMPYIKGKWEVKSIETHTYSWFSGDLTYALLLLEEAKTIVLEQTSSSSPCSSIFQILSIKKRLLFMNVKGASNQIGKNCLFRRMKRIRIDNYLMRVKFFMTNRWL